MNQKLRLWLSFGVVLALCCVDYAYFTEGTGAQGMSDAARKIAHLAILTAIIPAGYWGWAAQTVHWPKTIWLWSYVGSLSAIVGIGIACYLLGFRNEAFLKKIGDLRLFFCSPLPFLALYILSRISDRFTEPVKQ